MLSIISLKGSWESRVFYHLFLSWECDSFFCTLDTILSAGRTLSWIDWREIWTFSPPLSELRLLLDL